MINQFRKLLVRIGKILPFVLCFIVFISYVENTFALATNDFIYYDGYLILNTPLSFYIGLKFEYDVLVVSCVFVLSVSINTCKWNKFAIAYLTFHLLEKSYFFTIELYKEQIFAICFANIVVSGLLVYKGVKIATQK